MATPNQPVHNSKPLTKKTFLPPLQKKILIYLASNEPETINESVKATKSHYKSTWSVFKKLEEKKLIKAVGFKSYQGQEYPRYWVSEDGAFIALCEGAKANEVIRRAFEVYPENRGLHYLLEATSILGTEAFQKGYFAIISKGKIETSDAAAMLLTQIQNGLTEADFLQYFELLQKYPEHRPQLDATLSELNNKLGSLEALTESLKKHPNKGE